MTRFIPGNDQILEDDRQGESHAHLLPEHRGRAGYPGERIMNFGRRHFARI